MHDGEVRDSKTWDPVVPPLIDDLLEAVVLCSNASLDPGQSGQVKAVGDPTETALLIAAAKRGILSDALQQAMPELREEPFDSESKAMATFNQAQGCVLVSVKGAPEAVLPRCIAIRTAHGDLPIDDDRRRDLLRRAVALGERGLRTLAVATRVEYDKDADPYRDLVFLGIVGLVDPPRPGVKDAIARCLEAGVQVVMVTGDHAATAENIAIGLGLIESRPAAGVVRDATTLPNHEELLRARVIARATPQQKLDLIGLHQDQGMVVAMTGDGVNDAPALKKADIGIAMGIRGTAVAREAAAMVLQDDDFSTIVEAIAQGRVIYDNIRKFVVYLFSCNISEILIVSLATIAGAPLPLLPLQILFLNLVTDVFPALALGVGQGSPAVMTRKPRPANERLLTGRHWSLIVAYGALMSASVLGAMAISVYALGFDNSRAVTVSFCTLALGQLWHVFNMRDRGKDWVRNEITANAWVWGAIALCLALVLIAVYAPGINTLLNLTHPGPVGWSLIVVMSLLPVLFAPIPRKISRIRSPDAC
jgi:Ca2+-transporting ATPase